MPIRTSDNVFPKRMVMAILFYVLVVALITVTVYFRNRETIYRQLDHRLGASAVSIQFVLEDTFHDRATAGDSISPEEDQRNIRLLTDLTRLSGLTYLYTVIIKDGEVYITSSSASEKEIATGTEVRYFAPYDEAVNLFAKKFQGNGPFFVTHTDRWGTFRAGIIRCESPAGRPYIAVAEMDIGMVLRELHTELVLTLAYALLLLAATVPVYLVLSSRLRNHADSLRQANERLRQEQKNRNRLEQELFQAQKMEAIGTLAGGIAHDFNNILSSILGYAELAQEECPPGSQTAKDLDQVILAGDRARDLVTQILAFSRQAEAECIPLQPASIVKETIKLLRSSLPATIEIRQDIDQDTAPILADPTQIHQILMNLCTNAFHAMETTGGTLCISLRNMVLTEQDLADIPHLQAGNFVRLSVKDDGPGIAPEVQKRIFEPYFTTKETGKGTGMGLAIVHGIVKSYGGFTACHSRIGEGAAFEITLPALEEKAVAETKQTSLVPGGTERILFIDDEKPLAEMARSMLERLGYTVTLSTGSLEALATFQSRPDAFDLVITDQTMPKMTGADLACRMLQIRPDLPIILCTGYSNLISEEKAYSLGIKGFALKPLTRKDTAELIRKVLDA